MSKRQSGLGWMGRVVNALMYRIGRLILRLLNVEVVGDEILQREGNLIIASSHFSIIDPVLQWVVLRRRAVGATIAIAMAELWRIPGLAWVLKRLRHIPVKRGSAASGKQAQERAVREVNGGADLLIYPHRRCIGKGKNPLEAPIAPGAAAVAWQTGRPILLSHISGSNDLMPLKPDRVRKWKLFRLRAYVRIQFASEVIDPANYTNQRELHADVVDRMRKLMVAEG